MPSFYFALLSCRRLSRLEPSHWQIYCQKQYDLANWLIYPDSVLREGWRSCFVNLQEAHTCWWKSIFHPWSFTAFPMWFVQLTFLQSANESANVSSSVLLWSSKLSSWTGLNTHGQSKWFPAKHSLHIGTQTQAEQFLLSTLTSIIHTDFLYMHLHKQFLPQIGSPWFANPHLTIILIWGICSCSVIPNRIILLESPWL